VKTSFRGIKDCGFDGNDGKHIDGKALTGDDGNTYRIYGKAAREQIQIGDVYEFEADEKGKIDPKTFRKEGEPKPEPKPSEPPINSQKQASIETQNAVTNVVNLWVGGKLDDVPEGQLIKDNVIAYLQGKIIGQAVKAQSGYLVDAAKEQGAVKNDELDRVANSIKTLGALRREMAKFGIGYQTEEEQEEIVGKPLSELSKDEYAAAYRLAWGLAHG
jgi:hypothetical protein